MEPTTLKDAERIIQSYPFKIRFAGMSGDTLSLAAQGWSFAMNQNLDHRYGEVILHLALKHEGMGLYGMTNYISIDRGFHSPAMFMQTVTHYAERGFEVTHIAPGFRICAYPSQIAVGRSFAETYLPIDPRPSYQEFDLANLKFFTPANPKLQDIIVSPEQVPEMMKMILGAQKKTIGEIKQREQSRRNLEHMYMRDGSIPIQPSHQIQAQIITLTG